MLIPQTPIKLLRKFYQVPSPNVSLPRESSDITRKIFFTLSLGANSEHVI